MDIPEGYKQCSKCGQVKPATIKFFLPRKNTPQPFYAECRDCYRKRNQKRYWDNRAKESERKRVFYQNNRDKILKRNRIWETSNPDKRHNQRRHHRLMHGDDIREKERKRRQTNIDKCREVARIYQRNNRTKARVYEQRKRAFKRSLPATFTKKDWQKSLEYFNGCCAYCGNPPSLFDVNPMRGKEPVLHQEHHIAESKGGGYTPANILPACQSCNLSKHDKDPDKWCIEYFGKSEGQRTIKRIKSYFSWIVYSWIFQDDQFGFGELEFGPIVEETFSD